MDSQAILFITILILIAVAFIGGYLYEAKKDGKKEEQSRAEEAERSRAAVEAASREEAERHRKIAEEEAMRQQEEAERLKKAAQALYAAIDHTDLMAFSDNECVYRVHYKDGTTEITRVGRAHPNEKVYFNKLI